ncbi:MAG: oxidoreductase, partial [Flavobacterium sp.]|nr:oxidoreductase [Flavobacterium sp.]
MKKILIIGGSKGIGSAILLQQLKTNTVFNISRTAPDISHPNLVHYPINILEDALPEIEEIDT